MAQSSSRTIATSDLRTDTRHRVRLWAQLGGGAAFDRDVVVHDLSANGFRFEARGSFTLGAAVELRVEDHGPLQAVVGHVSPGAIGCRFVTPLTDGQLAALLADGPFARARPTPRVEALPEPVVDLWPGWARVAVIFGGAGLCWSGVALVATRLLR